ncbi:DUF502 domain-containing protein [Haloarculaceae archaeon H-GB2-1]|nr:DUF502 domain-containing protein [Haloarculaceae archaeon H-GB11]MEA5407280.1 DUF502 domain-containing protein [Haloarculaceae archaeon H-GB2-1]
MTSRIKNSFVAGLVLIAPLAVTLYILQLLTNWLLTVVDPVVAWLGLTQTTANNHLLAQALTTGLIVSGIVLVGYLAQRQAGQRMFGNMGRIIDFVPLVNVIYGSVRQVANSLVDHQSRYESVVLVEYPREGVYSIGLVTGEAPPAADSLAGDDAVNVFLPNSPNPTAGRLVVVPDDQVHEIDMSVRAGLRLVVTTGIGEDHSPALRELPADD